MTYQIISERKLRNAPKITNSDNLYSLLKRYANFKQEQFIVITLNSAHCPMRIIIVSIGTINHTLAHAREVFYHAIRDLAIAIVICHNHPYGDVVPSEEDLRITENLVSSGNIIGIPVLDHLIINKKQYFSFKVEGIIHNNNYIEPTGEMRAIWKDKYSY
jgi:DNA repair protein RadC